MLQRASIDPHQAPDTPSPDAHFHHYPDLAHCSSCILRNNEHAARASAGEANCDGGSCFGVPAGIVERGRGVGVADYSALTAHSISSGLLSRFITRMTK